MKGPDYELDIKNYTFYNFATKTKHPNASRWNRNPSKECIDTVYSSA